MPKVEQGGDVSRQDVAKKPGFLDRLRGLFGKKEMSQGDIETVVDEVEGGEADLEDVQEAVKNEVVQISAERQGEIAGMQESLGVEDSGDPAVEEAVEELGALSVEESEAASEVVEGGVADEGEGEGTVEEIEESLFEKIANHGEDFAGQDEVLKRLEEYKKSDPWNDDEPSKDQMMKSFQALRENSFCLGILNGGKQEVFFVDGDNNIKKAEIDIAGWRGSVAEVQKRVVDTLSGNGWNDSRNLETVSKYVSEQKNAEKEADELAKKREKIAKGEFGETGVEGFLKNSESVADLETLKKLFGDFEGSTWDEELNQEEMVKAMGFFEALPIGACQVDITLNEKGGPIRSFDILFKAGNGELKKTAISVWDMDKSSDDDELRDIVAISQLAGRGSQRNDEVMGDRMKEALKDKGFSVYKNLFGTVEVPLDKVLKGKE